MTKITPTNIYRHELIGLHAEVVDSKNKYLVGIKGLVIDETKNMLVILDKDGKSKIIPKSVCTFRFTLPDGTLVDVLGSLIVGRPEDRLKKVIRRRW
ncbi:MAG: ribonuclease P protein subunit [Thermoprotei archaeon]|nr:MAG: ribonuclease P protein subunit [Thermoprotei archaeon]